MLKYFLVSALMLTSYASAEHECETEQNTLKANYTVTTVSDNKPDSSSKFVLWRNNNTVAHQYPNVGITQAWTLVRDTLIKPVRYFDNHERAIEYQPGERIHGHVERDFSYRYQLVSNELLDNMQVKGTSGMGCTAVEHREFSENGISMTLTWMPHIKLIQELTVSQNHTTRTWQLDNLSTPFETAPFFETRSQFKSTDYADIGDDHTDPFLTNMVNQGFLEAGASGFYDQHGHALNNSHAH